MPNQMIDAKKTKLENLVRGLAKIIIIEGRVITPLFLNMTEEFNAGWIDVNCNLV